MVGSQRNKTANEVQLSLFREMAGLRYSGLVMIELEGSRPASSKTFSLLFSFLLAYYYPVLDEIRLIWAIRYNKGRLY